MRLGAGRARAQQIFEKLKKVYFAIITASLQILWCWKCSWRKANAVSRACICALNEIIVLQKEVLFSYESVLNQFRFRFSLVQILFPSSFYSWKFCQCYKSTLLWMLQFVLNQFRSTISLVQILFTSFAWDFRTGLCGSSVNFSTNGIFILDLVCAGALKCILIFSFLVLRVLYLVRPVPSTPLWSSLLQMVVIPFHFWIFLSFKKPHEYNNIF